MPLRLRPLDPVWSAALLLTSLIGCGNGGVPDIGSTRPVTGGKVATGDPCAELGYTCGPVGDGFGHVVDCGTCAAPESCGGGGVHGKCGGQKKVCVPRTCADSGLSCGPQGDGCGGEMYCGSCVAGEKCGVAGPSTCGAVASCENLCPLQVQCAPGVTTTITGKVVAPTPPAFGTPDPVYDALVYVPNAAVTPFSPGVSCDQCGAEVSGDPLVLTHSGADGTFTLANVPVGPSIPVVIQIGRWRRQITVDVAPCVENALDVAETHLPRSRAEGDIPLMAMVTGSADPLECVLRKIGIADSEFTVPAAQGGQGRVQVYVANGASIPGAPAASQLWGTEGDLAHFDLVLFACEGKQIEKAVSAQQNVVDYANQGGRIFATHFSYTWLYDDAPFNQTGAWNPNTKPGMGMDSFTGLVDTSFAKGKALSEWLDVVAASTYAGSSQVEIKVAREDLVSVSPPGRRWIYTSPPDPVTVQHYTFDTPVDAPAGGQCGRVLFSDFHVTAHAAGGPGGGNQVFPKECDQTPLSPQERVLEFMLFDLSSCVEGGKNGACTPLSCESLGYDCGPAGDGCGGLLDCGKCPSGQECGLGGSPSVCASPTAACQPLTCADVGFHCGPAGDGCGGLVSCGVCGPGKSCGGGGVAGVCG